MQVLDLDEAADFLKMNPEVLRRKAKLGLIPGRKAGKRWIFVCEHLADWVSGLLPLTLNDSNTVVDEQPKDTLQCRSTSARKLGGFNSPHQVAIEYSNLLGLK
jgi:hypothetical protein